LLDQILMTKLKIKNKKKINHRIFIETKINHRIDRHL
jgi:hypothetical protein